MTDYGWESDVEEELLQIAASSQVVFHLPE